MHPSAPAAQLVDMLEIRPLSVDCLATARYVIASAIKRHAAAAYTQAQLHALMDFVQSPHYSDLLYAGRSYGAFIGAEMVAVAAWSASAAPSPTARLIGVFVQPLFGASGIGARLLARIEEEARAAGFRALDIGALPGAVGFLEASGYQQIGPRPLGLPSGQQIPVVEMRKLGLARHTVMH
ncbi:GNAT family N-acetyltransferase [Hyphomicrobium sulfonivorans]|nr:GNAT family N-acetyltransferase [Hyphomicrobium sulfonivorans]